jgi:WD40 repeat protein
MLTLPCGERPDAMTIKQSCIAFSPDGLRLAIGSEPDDPTIGVVALYDAGTGARLATLRGHTEPICSVAFSPDGSRLASASTDKTVKLWDVATGREAFTLRGHASAVLCVAFSPDGRRLATGSVDFTARIWDAPRDDQSR